MSLTQQQSVANQCYVAVSDRKCSTKACALVGCLELTDMPNVIQNINYHGLNYHRCLEDLSPS